MEIQLYHISKEVKMLHPDLIKEVHGTLFGQWKPSWEEMRNAVRWSRNNDAMVGDFSSVRAGACDYLQGLYATHLETRLLAHLENEGDECPLCALEADNAAQYLRIVELGQQIAQQGGEVVALQKQVEGLRQDLNNLTENKWTQTEIDAAKWRAQEMAKALEAGGE